ncbi:MAG TPA: hypothetical protein DD457_09355 [Gammaproteobacteria bacterium]|jgi:GNAT superfamily N-acetyltransferase|nr:hypothetical protein [Gammaproteobacteria bacterium]|tara:strand:+ start:2411 stop:3049 length:639 start_codon:yes stop_codon:yes gene_type:complete
MDIFHRKYVRGVPVAIEIQPLESQDARELSLVLAHAFEEDPLMSWIFKEAKFRVTLVQAWMRFELQSAMAMSTSWVSVDDDEIVAGTIWAPPGRDLHEGGSFRQLWYLVLGANPERAGELGEGLSLLGEMHPDEPHFYLNTVGVKPDLTGRGYGAAIVQHTLDIADRDGHPCYLESTSRRNLPLYERLGFEVVNEIAMPNGPTMWGMWRSER